jgi:hypothetical protein
MLSNFLKAFNLIKGNNKNKRNAKTFLSFEILRISKHLKEHNTSK